MVTHVYADGGVIRSNPSTLGGTWAWCHTLTDIDAGWARKTGDWGYFTPGLFGTDTATNNVAELYAVVLGLEALPDGWSGTVCSDSKITLERLRTWTNPPGVAVALRGVPPLLQQMVWRQVARLGWQSVRFLLHAGHPTRAQLESGTNSSGRPVSIHQVWCDAHCKAAADRYWLDQFPDAREVHYIEDTTPPIRLDDNEAVKVATVRRWSQEMSLMARSTRAARQRVILGTIIGGSAQSTLVTRS